MTKLLVSVRNSDEAEEALRGGAEVLDVKEPHHGSLGAPTPAAVLAVVAAVRERVPVSVAMGELSHGDWPALTSTDLTGVRFAKLGLAGAPPTWQADWLAWSRSLPRHVRRVAVAYADWQAAAAPHPDEILTFARKFADGVLLDTYSKQQSLPAIMPLADLRAWIARADAAGLLSAIAGSLAIEHIPNLAALRPTIIAVRGAVCEADRRGRLDRRLVQAAASGLRQVDPSDADDRAAEASASCDAGASREMPKIDKFV